MYTRTLNSGTFSYSLICWRPTDLPNSLIGSSSHPTHTHPAIAGKCTPTRMLTFQFLRSGSPKFPGKSEVLREKPRSFDTAQLPLKGKKKSHSFN